MKILVELPTWLGDAVMASSAIENLANLIENSCSKEKKVYL